MSDYADGLRELADFVDRNPELFTYGITVDLFAEDRAEFAEKARAFGSAEKRTMGSWYLLRKRFGPHTLELTIEREKICERVQTGTRIVTKPDPVAVADVPLVDVEEPVYEWKCPDSILGGAS